MIFDPPHASCCLLVGACCCCATLGRSRMFQPEPVSGFTSSLFRVRRHMAPPVVRPSPERLNAAFSPGRCKCHCLLLDRSSVCLGQFSIMRRVRGTHRNSTRMRPRAKRTAAATAAACRMQALGQSSTCRRPRRLVQPSTEAVRRSHDTAPVW